MPGVVFHGAQFCRHSQRIRNPPRGPLVIGREADPDMAIVEDRVVRTVGLLYLIERLGDQEAFQPVAGHERQRRSRKSRAYQERETRPASTATGADAFEHRDLPVNRRLIWLRIRRISGLVRLDIGWRHDQIHEARVVALD